MKCKIQHVNCYNYIDKKTGELKSGSVLTYTTIDEIDKDDGNGNISLGHPTETVFVPDALNWAPFQLKGLYQKSVNLVFERPIGSKQKYDELVDIIVLE